MGERSQIIPELDEKHLHEIARIGISRAPIEACGLLLEYPIDGRSVIELPNRSLEGETSYCFWGSDAKLLLPDYEGDAAIWHTHPSGNIGPSRADMQSRHPEFWYLVVALTEEGPIPTFF